MPSYRWVVESLMFLLYMTFGISWMAYAPLLKSVADHFAIKSAQAAMAISLVSVSKAFVPLLAGMLAARIGLKRTLLLGAALSCVAVIAPSAPSYEAFLAIRFVFGIGGAIIVTLMGPMAMEWFGREELPLVNGLNNVAVNTGITVALYTSVPLAAALGWQQALRVCALPLIVLTVLWAFLGAERTVAVDPDKPKAADGPKVTIGDMVRLRETWLIALAFGGPLSLYLALNTWLPTHFQKAFGLDVGAAARATGLFNLIGIPSAILGGKLTVALGLRRPIIMLSGILLPIASGTLICLGGNEIARYGASLVLGFAFFIATAPLFTIPTELAGLTSKHVAVLNGVVFSASYVISFISPLLVGWLGDKTGSLMPGLLVFAAVSGGTALAGFLLPETGPAGRD